MDQGRDALLPFQMAADIGRFRARNRIVVPPMASKTSNLDGTPSQATFEHYSRLTRSGAGIIFVEYAFINAQGRSEKNQLGIDQKGSLPHLKKICDIIKESGALAAMQITHAGGKSKAELTGLSLLTPSGLGVPAINGEGEHSVAAGHDEVKKIQDDFVGASRLAVQAGFDMVEFHCAHGYGLNQWLSPLTNKRTDEYGLSQSGRNRILREVIERVHAEFPEIILSLRFPGQDFIEGGLTPDDCVEIAKEMKKAGAGLLNVSSGLGGWHKFHERQEEGYLVNEAKHLALKQDLPVIAVGGFLTPEGVCRALSNETRIQFVALGRRILESPEKFRDDFGL